MDRLIPLAPGEVQRQVDAQLEQLQTITAELQRAQQEVGKLPLSMRASLQDQINAANARLPDYQETRERAHALTHISDQIMISGQMKGVFGLQLPVGKYLDFHPSVGTAATLGDFKGIGVTARAVVGHNARSLPVELPSAGPFEPVLYRTANPGAVKTGDWGLGTSYTQFSSQNHPGLPNALEKRDGNRFAVFMDAAVGDRTMVGVRYTETSAASHGLEDLGLPAGKSSKSFALSLSRKF
jgi:hypothetical protein